MSRDMRVASNFLYGLADPSKAEGVVFKIWAHTAAVIETVSFYPDEREVLFLPDTGLRVLNWCTATNFKLSSLRCYSRDCATYLRIHFAFLLAYYRYPATDFNLRRGLKWDAGEERAFTVDCQHIVQPNPIEYEENLCLLRERLTGNKVSRLSSKEVHTNMVT